MLSQYTWGQFFLFIGVVVAVYYVVIGLLYYQDELSALLKGKKVAPKATPSAGPAALVRTTSAFGPAAKVAAAAPAAQAEVEPASGAAENLPGPVELLVTGSLPDSAAAIGSDESAGKATDADTSSLDEPAEVRDDEDSPSETLDEADEQLAAMIRAAATATAAAPDEGVMNDDDDDLPSYAVAQQENGEPLIENISQTGSNIETRRGIDGVEAEIVYQPVVADTSDLFAVFDERLASPLDILPVVQEPLFEAESLAAFLAQVQRGEKPAIPDELRGTSLVEEMADLTQQNNAELFALFGQEV